MKFSLLLFDYSSYSLFKLCVKIHSASRFIFLGNRDNISNAASPFYYFFIESKAIVRLKQNYRGAQRRNLTIDIYRSRDFFRGARKRVSLSSARSQFSTIQHLVVPLFPAAARQFSSHHVVRAHAALAYRIYRRHCPLPPSWPVLYNKLFHKLRAING